MNKFTFAGYYYSKNKQICSLCNKEHINHIYAFANSSGNVIHEVGNMCAKKLDPKYDYYSMKVGK